MRRLIVVLLILSLTLALSFADSSYEDLIKNKVDILVNGVKLDTYDTVQSMDLPAFIVDGRTLLPLRKTFEIFGADPVWDGETRSITASSGGVSIYLKIDSNIATVNGKEVILDVPAKIYNNRTYVPLRFVSESFGVEPIWDGVARTVAIETGKVLLDELSFEVDLGSAKELSTFGLANSVYTFYSNLDSDSVLFIEKVSGKVDDNFISVAENNNVAANKITTFVKSSANKVYKFSFNDENKPIKNHVYVCSFGSDTIVMFFKNLDEAITDKVINDNFK